MSDLYEALSISKQPLFKYRKGKEQVEVQKKLVCQAMENMRKEHRKMSSRKVYRAQKENLGIKLGRDKFERIAFLFGYRVKHKRNVMKTTWD